MMHGIGAVADDDAVEKIAEIAEEVNDRTENIGALPFEGIVLAHSNVSEWQQFKSNKNNEAFLDRICVIKVPYCLRATEESRIYRKLLDHSELGHATCASETRSGGYSASASFSISGRQRSAPRSKATWKRTSG